MFRPHNSNWKSYPPNLNGCQAKTMRKLTFLSPSRIEFGSEWQPWQDLCTTVPLLLSTSVPLLHWTTVPQYLHSTCSLGRRWSPWSPWSPWRTAARAWGWSWSYRCTPPVTCLLHLLKKPKFVHPVPNTVSTLWTPQSPQCPRPSRPSCRPPDRVHCAGRLEGRPRPRGDSGEEAGGGRGLQGPGRSPEAPAQGARGRHCHGGI